MASSFSFELSTPGDPEEIQARIRGLVTERLRRSAHMRLDRQEGSTLSFSPQLRFPLAVWIYRRLSGEKLKVSFSGDRTETHVAVSGKLGGNAQVAADREFWQELISAAS